MTTQLEQLEAARRALSPEQLLPAFRMDDATRERYRSQPVLRGTAFTKAELLNLGEAADPATEIQSRVSS